MCLRCFITTYKSHVCTFYQKEPWKQHSCRKVCIFPLRQPLAIKSFSVNSLVFFKSTKHLAPAANGWMYWWCGGGGGSFRQWNKGFTRYLSPDLSVHHLLATPSYYAKFVWKECKMNPPRQIRLTLWPNDLVNHLLKMTPYYFSRN
jgi:hypothetical protein